MNIFVKDNSQLRREFFLFIKTENRPKNYTDCESQLLEMFNRHRAQIYRAQVAHHISNLISAHNITGAMKLFNSHILTRAPRTWFVYAYIGRYWLALIAIGVVGRCLLHLRWPE